MIKKNVLNIKYSVKSVFWKEGVQTTASITAKIAKEVKHAQKFTAKGAKGAKKARRIFKRFCIGLEPDFDQLQGETSHFLK